MNTLKSQVVTHPLRGVGMNHLMNTLNTLESERTDEQSGMPFGSERTDEAPDDEGSGPGE